MKIKHFILVLAIALNAIALYRTWVYAKTFSFQEIVGNNPFKPGLGIQQSLPTEAIDAKFLLEKHAINEVTLGQELLKNAYLSQRTGEFIYPTRVQSSKSKYLIETIATRVNACQAIESHHSVTLYACQ